MYFYLNEFKDDKEKKVMRHPYKGFHKTKECLKLENTEHAL